MKVQFKQLIEKTDRSGKAPVFLYFYYKNYQFKYFTGEKCEPKHWDADKGKFRRSLPGYQDAQTFLETLAEKTVKAYREYMQKGVVPTPAMLKSELLPETPQTTAPKKNFLELLEEFVLLLKQRGYKPNTLKKYNSTLNHFREYHKEREPVDIEGYTLQVHNSFLVFLSEGYDFHPNTIASMVKNLKVFFKFCREEKGINLHADYLKLRAAYIEPEKIFLTEEELDKIMGLEMNHKLSKVRDAFLFACYTGLRYSDLFNLSTNHIVDKGPYKVINIMPQKTMSTQKKLNKRVEIVLVPQALEIIERYQGRSVKSLPVITNQRMNEYLKWIARLAGLEYPVQTVTYEQGIPKSIFVPKWTCVSTHTARHTFATQSLMRGMDLKVLQEILGHSDIRTTMTYAKIVDEYKHKVMLEVWSRPKAS